MIRKLYFLLLLVVLPASAFAQRYADLEVLEARIGTSVSNVTKILPNQKVYFDGKTPYYITWIFINHGPDTLKPSDTLHFKSAIGVTYHAHTLLSADTFGMSPAPSPTIFNVPAGINPPYIAVVPWCDSAWINAKAGDPLLIDPDMSNNYWCVSIQANYAWAVGINTVSSEKDGFLLYPNPANDKLNIRFDLDNAKKVRILLRNTVGQVVYNYDVGDYSGILTHSIDIGSLPPGMYTAELHYNDQSIISKVAIQ